MSLCSDTDKNVFCTMIPWYIADMFSSKLLIKSPRTICPGFFLELKSWISTSTIIMLYSKRLSIYDIKLTTRGQGESLKISATWTLSTHVTQGQTPWSQGKRCVECLASITLRQAEHAICQICLLSSTFGQTIVRIRRLAWSASVNRCAMSHFRKCKICKEK